MRTCTCPVGTYLETPGAVTCPESFGQTQKLIFQRANQTAGLGSTTTLIVLATWTALKAMTDSTKAIITPFVSGVTSEVGKVKEYGSGNEVRNGIPIVFGCDPTKVTMKLYEYPQSVIRTLKALACESLEVGFINENGMFGLNTRDIAKVKGFPVQSFFVSDKMLGGFDQPDYNELSFSLPANWSDYFAIVNPTANFSALDL